jgi:hypothetical protein
MNLASRCREAIAQAASLKKELSVQKKKTAEAVHQTHQLIAQLKRMSNSPERQQKQPKSSKTTTTTTAVRSSSSQQHDGSLAAIIPAVASIPAVAAVTPDVAMVVVHDDARLLSNNGSVPVLLLEEDGDSEHKEDDVVAVVPISAVSSPPGIPGEETAICHGHAAGKKDSDHQDCPPPSAEVTTTQEPEVTTATSTIVAETVTTTTTAIVFASTLTPVVTAPLVVDTDITTAAPRATEPSPLPLSKPDAPASSEELDDVLLLLQQEGTDETEDEESSDTVAAEILLPPPSFPATASPMMTLMARKHHQLGLNDSYDEEYPEEPKLMTSSKKAASSLLSSIDAFEASFSTSFPDSFSPKDEDNDGEGGHSAGGLYNPFDTNSPTKSDPPPSCLSPPPSSNGDVNNHDHATSPIPMSNNGNPLSPKSSLTMSPRDTPPRKLGAFKLQNRLLDEKSSSSLSSSLLVKPLPMSLNMMDLKNHKGDGEDAAVRGAELKAVTPRTAHLGNALSLTASTSSAESPDIEVLSPNGQTRISMSSMTNNNTAISPSSSFSSPRASTTATTGGKSSSTSYEMVGGSSGSRFTKARHEGPDDEIFHARLRASTHQQQRVSPLPSSQADSNVPRFKKSLTISTTDTAKRSLRGSGPLSSRSNGSSTESSAGTSDTTASSTSPHHHSKVMMTTPTADIVGTTTAHGRFHRAARTFHHVGSAAAKVREIKAQRNRSKSAPRIRTSTPPSLTFNVNAAGSGENHHLPDRPQHKLTGYGAARARYERAIQSSPRDGLFKDKDGAAASSSSSSAASALPQNGGGGENASSLLLQDDGRQRRNVNLSNRQRRAADFGNGTSPLLASPKRLSSLVNTK